MLNSLPSLPKVDAPLESPKKGDGLKSLRGFSEQAGRSGQIKGTQPTGGNGNQTARVKQPQPKQPTGEQLQPRQPDTARPQRGSRRGNGTTNRRPRSSRKQPKQALTIADAMRNHGDQLTAFEQSEILEYQNIYFCGKPAAKKIMGIPHTPNNNGYDDDRGDYKLVVGDHLEYRYEIKSMLGRGSFGQVVKAYDHKKDTVVALKVIRNKKRFHHQALVEVKILEHLMTKDKEHRSNIVRVYGYFYFRNHLCITFEALSMNLYEFIKTNSFKGFSLGLIRIFATQLLHSLVFLQKEKIIHCDLKPENVLLKAANKSRIKLIDFGSSCFEDERVYTYIQSRFYRSPEVILGLKYDTSIDMWSFGCILSELYTGYPLFPGENEAEQIQCIMEILGVPPKRLINASTRKQTFFDSNNKPLVVPNSRGKVRQPGKSSLEIATGTNNAPFIDFLTKCLKWDPTNRIRPQQALEHEWIASGKAKTEEETAVDEEKKRMRSSACNAKALFPPIAGKKK